MITANTKLTALEVLTECGVETPEAVFGAMRVRIGGIAGINKPEHLINIPAECTTVEVIVGNKVYDLELSAGTAENNKNVRFITEQAKATLEKEGKEETVKAEKLQAAKALARNLKENVDYKPTAKEKPFLEKAAEMVENEKAALAVEAPATERIKIKSK